LGEVQISAIDSAEAALAGACVGAAISSMGAATLAISKEEAADFFGETIALALPVITVLDGSRPVGASSLTGAVRAGYWWAPLVSIAPEGMWLQLGQRLSHCTRSLLMSAYLLRHQKKWPESQSNLQLEAIALKEIFEFPLTQPVAWQDFRQMRHWLERWLKLRHNDTRFLAPLGLFVKKFFKSTDLLEWIEWDSLCFVLVGFGVFEAILLKRAKKSIMKSNFMKLDPCQRLPSQEFWPS
jgi:hypothetical protein